MKKKNLPEVERVKIKPLFGLKPGLWLSIAYLLALILLVFLVGILPDIKDGSKRVTFTSSFDGQAVFIDGNYAGGTPFTTKVKSGKHVIDYELNGNKLDSFEITVSHPVFFNWLFPRTMTVNSTSKMSESAFDALSSAFFNDVIAYSSIQDYDSTFRYNPVFTKYAQAVVTDGTFATNRKFRTFLEKACLFVTTEEMKNDAQNAVDLAGSNMAVRVQTQKKPVYSAPAIEKHEDGYLINNSFVISREPVSEAQYLQFIEENPEWDKSNIAELVSKGLADDYYLRDFTGSATRPVHNVSYFAAKAYCKWISEKTGKHVNLPTEEQWTLSCIVADPVYQITLVCASKADKPVAMLGGLWELTDTFYVPGDSSSTSEVQNLIKETAAKCDVIVKGGSYANKANEINAFTSGTSNQSLCSDFMGFRVAYN